MKHDISNSPIKLEIACSRCRPLSYKRTTTADLDRFMMLFNHPAATPEVSQSSRVAGHHLRFIFAFHVTKPVITWYVQQVVHRCVISAALVSAVATCEIWTDAHCSAGGEHQAPQPSFHHGRRHTRPPLHDWRTCSTQHGKEALSRKQIGCR